MQNLGQLFQMLQLASMAAPLVSTAASALTPQQEPVRRPVQPAPYIPTNQAYNPYRNY